MSRLFYVCMLVLAALAFIALYLAYHNAPEGRQDEDGFTAARAEKSPARKDGPITRVRKRLWRHRTR